MPETTAEQKNKNKEPPEERLDKAIRGSGEVLVTATTVFPFTLFPDTLTLDRTKLTLLKRSFIQTAQLVSMRIEDVLNVAANVGPLFGSVKITSRIFSTEKPYTLNYFWRDDALKIKRITQGYIIALQRKIDCDDLSTDELRHMLEELGRDDH